MSKYNKPFNPGDYITIFTDASFHHQDGRSGVAIWIKSELGVYRLLISMVGNKGSDMSERIGVHIATQFLLNEVPLVGKRVVFNCDSKSAIKEIEDNLTKDILGRHISVRAKHIRSHQGRVSSRSSVNTWCDVTAKRASNMSYKSRLHLEDTSSIKDKWDDILNSLYKMSELNSPLFNHPVKYLEEDEMKVVAGELLNKFELAFPSTDNLNHFYSDSDDEKELVEISGAEFSTRSFKDGTVLHLTKAILFNRTIPVVIEVNSDGSKTTWMRAG